MNNEEKDIITIKISGNNFSVLLFSLICTLLFIDVNQLERYSILSLADMAS